jgi:hypothetical protein
MEHPDEQERISVSEMSQFDNDGDDDRPNPPGFCRNTVDGELCDETLDDEHTCPRCGWRWEP